MKLPTYSERHDTRMPTQRAVLRDAPAMRRPAIRRVSGNMPTDYSYIARAADRKWGAIANTSNKIAQSIVSMQISQDQTAADLAASRYRDEMSQWSIDQAATLHEFNEFGDRNYETLEERFKEKSQELKEALGADIKYNDNKVRYSLSVDGVNRTVSTAIMGDVLNARTEKARADLNEDYLRAKTLEDKIAILERGVEAGLIKDTDAVAKRYEAEQWHRKQDWYDTIDNLDSSQLLLTRERIDSMPIGNENDEALQNQISKRLNERGKAILAFDFENEYNINDELQSIVAIDERRQELLTKPYEQFGFSDYGAYEDAVHGIANSMRSAHAAKIRSESAADALAITEQKKAAIRNNGFVTPDNKVEANAVFDGEVRTQEMTPIQLAQAANEFGSSRGGFVPDSIKNELNGLLGSKSVSGGYESVEQQYAVALSMLRQMRGLDWTDDLLKAKSIAIAEPDPMKAAVIWRESQNPDRVAYPADALSDFADTQIQADIDENGLGFESEDKGAMQLVKGLYIDRFNAIYAGSKEAAHQYAVDWIKKNVSLKDGVANINDPFVIWNTGDERTDQNIRTNLLLQFEEASAELGVNLLGSDVQVVAVTDGSFDRDSNPAYHFLIEGRVMTDDDGQALQAIIRPVSKQNVSEEIRTNVEKFFVETDPLGNGANPPMLPDNDLSLDQRRRQGRKILNRVYKFLEKNKPSNDSPHFAQYQAEKQKTIGNVVHYLNYIGYAVTSEDIGNETDFTQHPYPLVLPEMNEVSP